MGSVRGVDYHLTFKKSLQSEVKVERLLDISMSVKPELMTAQQLANALNLSVETIWRYTRMKRIPYVEVGVRQYRYDFNQVMRAMNQLVEGVAEGSEKYTTDSSLTYRDYLKLPEEPGIRHEILDGLLVKEPSPSIRHQRISSRLQGALRDYFRAVDPEGEILDAPLDVVLSEKNVVQPDLLYIPGSEKAVFEQTHVFIAPKLLIEILSPSTRRRDRLEKMDIYSKAGVLHYWIVDPDICIIEAYVLKDNYYTRVSVDCDTVFTHPDFPELNIPFDDIFPS